MNYSWHRNNYPTTIYDCVAPDGTRIGGVTHCVVTGDAPPFHTSVGEFHSLDAAKNALIEAYEKRLAAEKEKTIVADGKRSIYRTATPELFNSIFDILIHDMCGDDDVVLFCRYYDYKQVVEIFKEYQISWGDGIKKAKEVYDVSEEPQKNRVIFHMGQDNVCIGQYDGESDMEEWPDMVIIK